MLKFYYLWTLNDTWELDWVMWDHWRYVCKWQRMGWVGCPGNFMNEAGVKLNMKSSKMLRSLWLPLTFRQIKFVVTPQLKFMLIIGSSSSLIRVSASSLNDGFSYLSHPVSLRQCKNQLNYVTITHQVHIPLCLVRLAPSLSSAWKHGEYKRRKMETKTCSGSLRDFSIVSWCTWPGMLVSFAPLCGFTYRDLASRRFKVPSRSIQKIVT